MVTTNGAVDRILSKTGLLSGLLSKLKLSKELSKELRKF